MKKSKKVVVGVVIGVAGVFVTVLCFQLFSSRTESSDKNSYSQTHRSVSSVKATHQDSHLAYESQKACEKQAALWKKITESEYFNELPEYSSLGLMQVTAMGMQHLSHKGYLESDVAPQGWKKYLHRRASIAKVKWVSKSSGFTGVFKGAECGLLRLSLTYAPKGSKPVAPGLALKILRDGTSSANISALVSLDGQGKNFNFFSRPMSNIVPIGDDVGQKMVHSIFSRVSNYPEELLAEDMAMLDARGLEEKKSIAPRQLFFVPNDRLKFSTEEHDVRHDFAKVPSGTTLYRVYALPPSREEFNYQNYKDEDVSEFLKKSELIGEIVTTSKFKASSFGDDEIFFKHEWRPKK